MWQHEHPHMLTLVPLVKGREALRRLWTSNSLLCTQESHHLKSDREKLMVVHVYTFKSSFEQTLQPASLGAGIFRILKAHVPMCVLNSPLSGKLQSFLLGGLCCAESSIPMQCLL